MILNCERNWMKINVQTSDTRQINIAEHVATPRNATLATNLLLNMFEMVSQLPRNFERSENFAKKGNE